MVDDGPLFLAAASLHLLPHPLSAAVAHDIAVPPYFSNSFWLLFIGISMVLMLFGIVTLLIDFSKHEVWSSVFIGRKKLKNGMKTWDEMGSSDGESFSSPSFDVQPNICIHVGRNFDLRRLVRC
ncbi:uncharacterized protein LOC125202087 [Salvia hispanica]|uniref:uncharacterized protein LOC125202087 n=1 Tax=Salvia hispanica TaxID=49212 RepID=UPI00200989B9|nr:uncharacterized protein LOC125202087 [Salvia hispanica]